MATITASGAALGATVTDVDLRESLDEPAIAELRQALLTHEVLIFPDQGLSPAEQVRFGESFGQLEVHAVLDRDDELPEVVVMDTAEGAPTAEWWHTDVTCSAEPPLGVILQIVIAAPSGGATHWASMTAAYDALDDPTKHQIAALSARHESWWKPVEEAVHPVVRQHPESGRTGLFVNGIFTKEIVEASPDGSDALLDRLVEHATRDEFTWHHEWSSGDIAFWDNRVTQHRVDADFGDARRRGHRIAIEGDRPVAPRP
ncbi:MAG: TauD/TfdA dioxygenase family protein [Acidimicrobiales bacterium]